MVDGGMTRAYVTPEGPALAAPVNNAYKTGPIDKVATSGGWA